MMEGKARPTLRLIADDNNSGPLRLVSLVESGNSANPETVRDALKEKHPPGQPGKTSAIFSPSTPATQPHPVLFDRIDEDLSHNTSSRQMGLLDLQGLTQLPGSAFACPSNSHLQTCVKLWLQQPDTYAPATWTQLGSQPGLFVVSSP